MFLRKVLLSIIPTLLFVGQLCAQSFVGTYFSVNRSGVAFSKTQSENIFWKVDLGIDYGNSVLHKSHEPGVAASFSYNFVIAGKQTDSGTSRLYVGPGVLLGWMRDTDQPYGFMGGLCGSFGYEYEFNSPFTISISIMPTLGLHAANNGSGILLDIYDIGLLWSLSPQIGVKYNIGAQSGHGRKVSNGSQSEDNTHRRAFPLFTYGVELDYSAAFCNFYHHNYLASGTGNRVDATGSDLYYENNGIVLGHFGVNAGKHLNFSVYGGYGSIAREEQIFPLSLRATWLFGKDPLSSRWLCFLDGGVAIRSSAETGGIGKIGGGYRISLSRSVKLDLMFSYQLVYSEITIADSNGVTVTENRMRRNDNYLNSINLAIGITL